MTESALTQVPVSECYLKSLKPNFVLWAEVQQIKGGVQSVLVRLGAWKTNKQTKKKCLGVVSWQWRWTGGGVSKLVMSPEGWILWLCIMYSLELFLRANYIFFFKITWELLWSCFQLDVWLWFQNSQLTSVEVCSETSVIGSSLSDNPRDMTTPQQWNIKSFLCGCLWD